ncbi:MAG: hypothetical protein AAF573_03390 [Bacteroidota bacterium]
MLKNLLSILMISWSVVLVAQGDDLSNWRTQIADIQGDSINLDSLSIVPESVQITNLGNNQIIDTALYEIKNSTIYFKNRNDSVTAQNGNTADTTSLEIKYRTLPFSLHQPLSFGDTTLIRRRGDGTYIGVDYSPFEQKRGLLDQKGLDYNGSFARGLSFGNNQSLVLNSSFNLQLAGTLGDDIEILAAISDNSIPLQPEGNTQQLQEFDRIFIQLKKDNNKLIAGDYELQRPNSYFMNYFKKLQGATFSNQTELFSEGILKSNLSAAIARGKFARNNIVALEGNQGPYRLEGAEGERFIIVLSGTEKVYVDGRLMVRGVENDYIIDYNRGDITFTNRRLITKDSRIVVDFEYNVQNYTRSMIAYNAEYQHKKWKVNFNLYNEQDGKTSTGLNELTAAQKQFIAEQGDQLDEVPFTGIDTLEGGFDPDRIMYARVDTSFIINGVTYTDTIAIYSINPTIAIYIARFSEVGQGNGNYIIDTENAINGRVYKWVAPDSTTGIPQGRFEPIIRLSAPQKLQMMTLGAEYQINKTSSIFTEVGMSNKDLNRFSKLDSEDDRGFSLFTNYKNERNIGKKEKGWKLLTDVKYEFVQDKFNALNPYRPAEFLRDWNLAGRNNNTVSTSANNKRTEHIGTAGFEVRHKKASVEYEFSGFIRDSVYTGAKHFSKVRYNQKGFSFLAHGSLLQSEDLEQKSDFFRPRIDISQTFKKLNDWSVGVYGEREKNERKDLVTDTLNRTSYYYDLYRVYVKSPQKDKFNFGLNHTQRFDYQPVTTDFLKNTTAREWNINGSWNQSRNARLGWNMTYRELEINDSTLTDQAPQQTYLGRIDYAVRLFKNLIRSTTTYDIGSGQERKIEFIYEPVNDPNLGQYVWIDYNDDGEQQNNEFEVAVFPQDTMYIRIPLLSDLFIRTNNVQFNQSLSVNSDYFRNPWFQKKGLKNIISRISTNSTFLINRKTREIPGVSQWNPFQIDIPDEGLVSINSVINNTLIYNKRDPKFRCQFNFSNSQNRLVLTSGFESRSLDRQSFQTFWNLRKPFDFEVLLEQERSSYDSEFFNNRDYELEGYAISPQFTYRISQNFRTELSYKYRDRKNILSGGEGETATFHDFSFESKYNRTAKTRFLLRFSFIDIAYDGERNTPVEFAILESLQNGKNYLWNFTYERRLAKSIDLEVSYDGRKRGEANTIHTGRATVRATF